jgi:hypothetical protein
LPFPPRSAHRNLTACTQMSLLSASSVNSDFPVNFNRVPSSRCYLFASEASQRTRQRRKGQDKQLPHHLSCFFQYSRDTLQRRRAHRWLTKNVSLRKNERKRKRIFERRKRLSDLFSRIHQSRPCRRRAPGACRTWRGHQLWQHHAVKRKRGSVEGKVKKRERETYKDVAVRCTRSPVSTEVKASLFTLTSHAFPLPPIRKIGGSRILLLQGFEFPSTSLAPLSPSSVTLFSSSSLSSSLHCRSTNRSRTR